MKQIWVWLSVIVVLLFSGMVQSAVAEDCAKATTLYNLALDTPALRQRERLLNMAIPLCSQPEVLARIYNNLADTYEKQNRISLALRFYRQALRVRPDLATAYFSVGDLFYRLGDFKSAAIMYDKGLHFQPSDEDAEKKREAEAKSRQRMLIYFPYDSFEVPEAYLTRIDTIGDAATECRDSRIRVVGHTCDLGSAAYNRELSSKRSRKVAANLIQHSGIDPGRIEVIGTGESEPMLPGRAKENRELNRCVEIMIVDSNMK